MFLPFFFPFGGKRTKMKSLWKVKKVEDRFCTGRNSINFIWISPALKWQDQKSKWSNLQHSESSRKTSLGTAWMQSFLSPLIFTCVSARWFPQNLRYRIWSPKMKKFLVQFKYTESSRSLNKHLPLGCLLMGKFRTIWLIRKKWPWAQPTES